MTFTLVELELGWLFESPEYDAVIRKVPTVVSLYATVQDPPLRLQLRGVNVPVLEADDQVTVPVAEIGVAVAVHVEDVKVVMVLGVQVTEMVDEAPPTFQKIEVNGMFSPNSCVEPTTQPIEPDTQASDP